MRTLTGFTPSGLLHLGNLVGAIRPIVAAQKAAAPDDTIAFVSDLHAMTLEHDPTQLRARTREFATTLIAAGMDPAGCLLMVQSHVPEHTELHYLLECVAGYGEAHRMIQFKQKSGGRESVRLSLLTYPILMAADILLYGTAEVPVGEDQRQHVELARDLAERFNARYGEVFVVPKAVNPPVAARLKDLTDPARKMSKSAPNPAGALRLLAPPDELRRAVMRAVTDDVGSVAYEPEKQPGVTNLLDVLAACTGRDPREIAGEFTRYGDLKKAVADAVIATVEPVQRRYAELAAAPEHVDALLRQGAERARALAAPTVRAAKEALGLVV
jgi:tryptophanyl-tRNA synthetase